MTVKAYSNRIITVDSVRSHEEDGICAASTENHSSRENGPPNLNVNPMLGHGDRRHYPPIMGNSCRRSEKFAREVFLGIYLIGLKTELSCS